MMRCLFLTVHPAFPAVTGADLRNWQNACAASQLGEVLIVSLVAGSEGATTFPGVATGHLAGDAETVHRMTPGGTSMDLRIELEAIEALRRVVLGFKPDLVVLEHIGLHPFVPMLQEFEARLVLDLHNVESELAGQIRRRRDWFGIKRRRDKRAIAALEARLAGGVDAVWVCSDDDAARLRARQLGPVSVIPNGLPRAMVAPRELPVAPMTAGPEVLYIGHFNYVPNVVACKALARRILPRLRRDLPQARVTLAGRSPARRVRRLAADDVRVITNPDDLAPLLAAAHMTIVPLRSGGGTRFKIVEAMAWGVPVVATPLAAEGLGLRDGEDILFGVSDRDLADQAAQLWQDADRREALRRKAHAVAWARFGPDVIDRAVLSAIQAVKRS